MTGKIGMKKGKKNPFCSKCNKKRDMPNNRYCKKCHAGYMREWRKTHSMNEDQKFKDSVRHKTNMRVRRGLLIKYPCEICGIKKVEAHHDDYKQTYKVRWLCFKHHRELHKKIKENHHV